MSASQSTPPSKNPVDKLWESTKAVIDRGRQEVERVSKVSRIKLDSSSLQRERQKMLLDLANEVLSRVKKGKIRNAELKARVDEINALEEKISAAESKIKEIYKD